MAVARRSAQLAGAAALCAAASAAATAFTVSGVLRQSPQATSQVMTEFAEPQTAWNLEEPVTAVPSASNLCLACAAFAVTAAYAARTTQKAKTAATRKYCAITRKADEMEYGEDLAVPGDSFIVLGLANCFEQGEGGKLYDKWVLEPVSASTVEVVDNGAATSYVSFLGTDVATILAQDISKLPAELLCGHEVQFGDNLQFRTGCAARTWMREHAATVVRKLVPVGKVTTGFNTSVEHKRILNFVNEVKDSDNVKQDMSIDVYGREEEKSDEDAQIADLYNV
eukprot:TRINITY_DN2581_c6_g1_i1.p1 TRINITY_DN2581_c6_g1~~TRINITY_DN2581_c6_g1_i1.p1  ORF type:complete len:282 (+),score=74.67 TRINITY_DN2581_c6_g1_i1:89-934(+)